MRYRSAALGIAFAASAALAACGGAATIHVDPIDAYRAYDDFHPDKDKAILAKAAAVDGARAPVRIFQEALPAGIELKEGVFGVAPGYGHRLIGKFAYSPGRPVPKVQLVARVKQLAVAANGDAAIVLFRAVDGTDYDVAQGVEAIILHLDPRSGGSDPADKAPPLGTRSL